MRHVRSEISAVKSGRIKATHVTNSGAPTWAYVDWSSVVAPPDNKWTEENVREFFEESGADRAEAVIAAADQELAAITSKYDA